MELAEFAERLNETLDVDAWQGTDYAINGLQVGDDKKEVERAAFAVDGACATFEAAADVGADVLVVHHGISWGGIDRVTGTDYDRVSALVAFDLALYAVHLPLDAHPRYGNAALLAQDLGFEVVAPFGQEGPGHVGQRARTPEPLTPDDFGEALSAVEDDSDIQHLPFGPETIEDVGIITGSGTDWIREAREKDLDALVTGEGKQQAYHEAREAGLHVYLAGHYATETYGVRALERLVGEWGLDTSYISHPTGI